MKPALKTADNAQVTLKTSVSTTAKAFLLETGEGAELPQPINGTTDDTGDATTLELTAVGSLVINSKSIAVLDEIWNVTDGSHALVLAINTDSITTTPLRGGTANVWASGDEFSVNPFMLTVVRYSADGASEVQKEIVRFYKRAGDQITADANGRAQEGTTALEWTPGDYLEMRNPSIFWETLKEKINYLRQLIEGTATIPGQKTFDLIPKANGTPSADTDLVTKAFMFANLGGGGEVTKTLDGSCSAADRLYVKANGNFAKASAAENTQETTLKTVASLTQAWTVKVAANRWVKLYATASQAYAQAGTFDASGNWVGGTEVNFFSGTVSYVSACKQGDDEGVIYVQNNTAAKLFHFTVDDSPSAHDLTVSTAFNGPTGLLAGSSRRRHKIVRLTDTTFACGTFKTGAMGYFLGTNTSGTLAMSVFHQMSTYASAHDFPGDICRVDDTHILCASYYADGVGAVRGKVYDVSNQASPSQTAPASGFYSFGSSNNAWCTFDEVGADGDNLIAGWHSYGNEGLWQISGSTITSKGTWTSPYNTEVAHYNEGSGVYKVADNIWGCVDTTNIEFFGFNGSSVDSLGEFAFAATVNGGCCTEGVAACTIDSSTAEAVKGEYDTAAFAHFLANEAQTDGNSLKGIGSGGIMTAESGLTPGVKYLIDGTVWGLNLSATEVFVTKTVS